MIRIYIPGVVWFVLGMILSPVLVDISQAEKIIDLLQQRFSWFIF